MSLLEQQSFIKGIIPFDNLTNMELEEVSKKLDIHYFQKDQFIVDDNSIQEQNLYFVITKIRGEYVLNNVDNF